MAPLLLSSTPRIVASKRRPSRRKSKRVAFPRVLVKRILTSLASSPLVSQLPPPLDLLPPLIVGPRRVVGSSRGQPLFLLLSAVSASVLGFNVKGITRMKLQVVLPKMGNPAGYFLLGFVVCFLICQSKLFPGMRGIRWKF